MIADRADRRIRQTADIQLRPPPSRLYWLMHRRLLDRDDIEKPIRGFDWPQAILECRNQHPLVAFPPFNLRLGRTTLWAAINRSFLRGDIDIRRFTPHDTRSTAKGHLRNFGISREISEIALNHKLKGMEGVYDVREEIPERRRALNIWADFIVECATGCKAPRPPSNVIPLRRLA